tara:strand:- start:7 stop:207 length:201 start_codon:yes stop_codon:yes gene_type:complete
MNGRRLFREYARSKGYEAKEFVEIKDGWYDESDTLVTKDNNGNEERASIDYKSMIHWIIKTKKEQV